MLTDRSRVMRIIVRDTHCCEVLIEQILIIALITEYLNLVPPLRLVRHIEVSVHTLKSILRNLTLTTRTQIFCTLGILESSLKKPIRRLEEMFVAS